MKGIAEDIYHTLLVKEIFATEDFIKWCNYIKDMKQKMIRRRNVEKLPNIVTVADMDEEPDLLFLVDRIVKEKVLGFSIIKRFFCQVQNRKETVSTKSCSLSRSAPLASLLRGSFRLMSQLSK
ncbi:retrotrans_gag domain-containing protein [Nephila pilipes]|uniref:Retrotrans_gag domain-containing protein n=1 Tax=Nephila pilipes TaxID=299642 RepID=A0A8X6UB91_NEPPI|nr:retrotrans_gag domain-containing protein [Nephila pilipes]